MSASPNPDNRCPSPTHRTKPLPVPEPEPERTARSPDPLRWREYKCPDYSERGVPVPERAATDNEKPIPEIRHHHHHYHHYHSHHNASVVVTDAGAGGVRAEDEEELVSGERLLKERKAAKAVDDGPPGESGDSGGVEGGGGERKDDTAAVRSSPSSSAPPAATGTGDTGAPGFTFPAEQFSQIPASVDHRKLAQIINRAISGFAIVSTGSKKGRKFMWMCHRHGSYTNNRHLTATTRQRNTPSQKTNCPWKMTARRGSRYWLVRVITAFHNHEPSADPRAHPSKRLPALNPSDRAALDDWLAAGASATDVQARMRRRFEDRGEPYPLIPRDIYNLTAARNREAVARQASASARDLYDPGGQRGGGEPLQRERDPGPDDDMQRQQHGKRRQVDERRQGNERRQDNEPHQAGETQPHTDNSSQRRQDG